MISDTPHILFVNPWIHDFAAYDVWAKPYGLLSLAAITRSAGYRVSYIDCLDRFHPRHCRVSRASRQGRGPYLKAAIPKPTGLADIPRTFSRYGIPPQWFLEDLKSMAPPDLVMVTSHMTYWYPGVAETIRRIRNVWPQPPIIVGGIYATLCPDHAAAKLEADQIVVGEAESRLPAILAGHFGLDVAVKGIDPTGEVFSPHDINTYPRPAFDLQSRISYVPLLTARGCPFSCAYCASHVLNPRRQVRQPESVVAEIAYWHNTYGILDFALYDDAFLLEATTHAMPIMEGIIRQGLKVRLHTPNALHLRWITRQCAELMWKSGFKTIRLGLETTDFDERNVIDRKVSQDQFQQAVTYLKAAGFNKKQLGAYLLAGLPGQSFALVEDSIAVVKKAGITPIPAYYTPIPHTRLWDQALAVSRYDLETDPIFTNNAIMPCQKTPFSWDVITRLKALAAAK